MELEGLELELEGFELDLEGLEIELGGVAFELERFWGYTEVRAALPKLHLRVRLEIRKAPSCEITGAHFWGSWIFRM